MENSTEPMKSNSDIYDEVSKKLSDGGCQSVPNIAIAAMCESQKELFYYLSDLASENPDKNVTDFFDEIEIKLF